MSEETFQLSSILSSFLWKSNGAIFSGIGIIVLISTLSIALISHIRNLLLIISIGSAIWLFFLLQSSQDNWSQFQSSIRLWNSFQTCISRSRKSFSRFYRWHGTRTRWKAVGSGKPHWNWTNPNLRWPLLFFPTTHVTVNLFEKCCILKL